MPFTATSPDRTTRYVLPGASDIEKRIPGAIFLDGTEGDIRDVTVVCPDAHCDDAPLVFRRPAYRNGEVVRRASWAHAPGRGLDCSYEGEGGAGEWHNRIQFDVLGGAIGHEHSVPGARADVIIATPNGQFAAVEVQHSPIHPETVRRRHAAHKAAGLRSTIWIVDGDALTSTPAVKDAIAGDLFTTGWFVDLLRACLDSGTYRTTVGVLADGSLRFVDKVRFLTDEHGAQVALVSHWTAPVTEEAMRVWACGPKATAPNHLDDEVADLRHAHRRKVKLKPHAFYIAHRGSRVRVGFAHFHHSRRKEGEELGLEWRAKRRLPDGTRVVGQLIGPLTPDVTEWLALRFGEQTTSTVVELSNRRRLEQPDAEAA